MKWLKKILWRWTQEGREIYEYEGDNGKIRLSKSRLISHDDCEAVSDDPILNFKVFNAVGGKVVELVPRHHFLTGPTATTRNCDKC